MFDLGLLLLLEGKPVVITGETENRELALIDRQIAELQTLRLKKVRDFARQKGETALKLEDLKSESGKPFIRDRESVRHWKSATADVNRCQDESAYLCCSEYTVEDNNPNTCGWVKGEPKGEKFDNIGPLSGSSGRNYYCRICNKLLVSVHLVHSLHG